MKILPHWANRHIGRSLLVVCITLVVAGCSPLPALTDRTVSTALSQQDAQQTKLGRTITALEAKHPDQSGIYPLNDPHEAFAVRALLAASAERTLDIQYYIWHDDLTGTLMFDALRTAADRGIRVRLLLDDNDTSGLDPTLAALNMHHNIEVRVFNPFVPRSPRWLSYITDFSRVNRRMHNKSFTSDNMATIIGGRNVGDEYFGATHDVLFSDLDVLAVGPVVRDVSADFDKYWRSESAYPVDLLLEKPDEKALEKLQERADAYRSKPEAAAYIKALKESNLVSHLHSGDIDLDWAKTQMVSDDPAKGLKDLPPDQLMAYDMKRILGEPKSSADLVSAYFVPTKAGVEGFVQMAGRGVKVRILTNSLEATDVAAVHAGYAKRRKPLLEAGVKLYELRRLPSEEGGRHRNSMFGSSGSSLHAKTFSVDDARVFIGSFNFDPRSAKLNTELGFVIDSPVLAKKISEIFLEKVPSTAYEVRLSENGDVYWLEQKDGQELRYDSEPGASLGRRVLVEVLSLLPVEWLL
ncbi:phospholipase D family protein [Alcaligenaceae bacterium]|nr:phospholipase D family protein [Alcaligenaceae bacterium]